LKYAASYLQLRRRTLSTVWRSVGVGGGSKKLKVGGQNVEWKEGGTKKPTLDRILLLGRK
jgi:hypothetical protein